MRIIRSIATIILIIMVHLEREWRVQVVLQVVGSVLRQVQLQAPVEQLVSEAEPVLVVAEVAEPVNSRRLLHLVAKLCELYELS